MVSSHITASKALTAILPNKAPLRF